MNYASDFGSAQGIASFGQSHGKQRLFPRGSASASQSHVTTGVAQPHLTLTLQKEKLFIPLESPEAPPLPRAALGLRFLFGDMRDMVVRTILTTKIVTDVLGKGVVAVVDASVVLLFRSTK